MYSFTYFLILLLSMTISVCYSTDSDITQFIMIGRNNQFYNINTTTCQVFMNVAMGQTKKYDFQTILSGDSTNNTLLFLATDMENWNDVILEYSITTNNLTEIASINGYFTAIANPQIYAYDPVYNFVAVPAFTMHDPNSNLTIYTWDFNTKELTSVQLPTGPMNGNAIYPEGAYDATTGDYYLIYNDRGKGLSNGTFLVVYNMWSKTIVKGPIFFKNFFMGAPNILFYNGQVFFMNMATQGHYGIYAADLTTQTTTNIFRIPNHFSNWLTFTSTFGQKGSNVVLFSSTGGNVYQTTIIDLETLAVTASPKVPITIKFEMENMSVGI
ncbi:hypothetical protein PPL_04140 [Heterostelium album PN500]|uniref:Uncharacterized protein n=1 Tax=Heterostelium pallidum (strain ATCC 26659 / Pp 5 / PN500) TaxID=670386 RepID=D3B649_HETP5|nr:hypothetical protein PPL_04140 [Heterostelium album PN500]EFA83347.1 hypothetical protein PPL_04140 [Heterostelium album PN500]|eukprot:XP_020435464.1 hypothetical protein PPL_04140 [Heterostelium album PN500]